jgi:hypothetical protein
MERNVPRAQVGSLRTTPREWFTNNWRRAAFITGAGLFIFLLVSGVKWACHADYRQGRVEQLEWYHRTDLRQRTENTSGHWDRAPRTAGYYDESTWGHHCYDKDDGSSCCATDDKGFCTMWCTDYRRWCDYHYWDWPVKTSQEVHGFGHETSWATFGSSLDDNHRETHEGSYVIQFTNTKEHWRYQTDSLREYRKFKIDDLWQLKFPNVGKMRPTKKTTLEAP